MSGVVVLLWVCAFVVEAPVAWRCSIRFWTAFERWVDK